MLERSTGLSWHHLGDSWQRGICQVSEIRIEGRKVLGRQQSPISSPTGGGTIDAEARSTLVGVLSVLREHGLIAS